MPVADNVTQLSNIFPIAVLEAVGLTEFEHRSNICIGILYLWFELLLFLKTKNDHYGHAWIANQSPILFSLCTVFQTSDIVAHRKITALKGLPLFLREKPGNLLKMCLVMHDSYTLFTLQSRPAPLPVDPSI